jgi:hypothetical protein
MTQIPDEELMTLIQQVIAWNHDLGINEKNIVE